MTFSSYRVAQVAATSMAAAAVGWFRRACVLGVKVFAGRRHHRHKIAQFSLVTPPPSHSRVTPTSFRCSLRYFLLRVLTSSFVMGCLSSELTSQIGVSDVDTVVNPLLFFEC